MRRPMVPRLRPRAFPKSPLMLMKFPLQVREVRMNKVGMKKRMRLFRNQ